MTEPLRTVAARFTVKFDTTQLQSGNAWIKKVQGSLKILGGAVGAGIAIRGITRFTDKMTKLGDEISKGARTVSFSRKAFQEWSHTIELAGGTERFFSKYVFFLQRGIGEAVQGLKTYSDAFRQIGLSPQELIKLSPEEQFEKVFVALSKVESAAMRNAMAQRILGRGGRELTVAMKEGFEQHVKNRKELQRLGGVIRDDVLKRTESFRDRLVILTKAMRGFKFRALDLMLDTLEPMLDTFIEFIGRMNKLIDRTWAAETAMIALKVVLALVAAWIVSATWPFLLLVAAVGAAWAVFDDLYTAMQGGKSVIDEWVKAWTGKDLKTHLEEIRKQLRLFADEDEVNHYLNAMKMMLDDILESLEGISAWWSGDGDSVFSKFAGWLKDILFYLTGITALKNQLPFFGKMFNYLADSYAANAPVPAYQGLEGLTPAQRGEQPGPVQHFNMEIFHGGRESNWRAGYELGNGVKDSLRDTGHALDG